MFSTSTDEDPIDSMESLPQTLVLRHWRIVLAAIVLTSVLVSCAFAFTKRPWCDEAWFASPAYNLLHHGNLATTVLDPHGYASAAELKGIDRFTYWIMPGYLIAQAGWYMILGFSLFSMRLLSIAWGVVALLSWFAIVRWMTGNLGVALLATLLLGTEQQFIRSAGYGRMDMMCFALGLASLATYLLLRERWLLLALTVSASLATMAVLTHPNGLFSTLIVVGLVVWLDRRRITGELVFAAAVPVFLLTFMWGWYVLQAPDLFLAQMRIQGAFLNLPTDPVRAIAAEFSQRYSESYGLGASFPASLGTIVFCGYVLAIATNLLVPALRRNPASRVLLVLTAFQFAALLCVKKSWYYLIDILPFYTGLLAVAAHWMFLKGNRWKPGVSLVVTLITAINLGFIFARVRHNDKRQFEQAVNYLRQNALPGDLIMGSGELAFELGFDGQVIDDARLGYSSGRSPKFIVMEPQYRSHWMTWLKAHEPASNAHILLILRQYDLVYDQSGEKQPRQFSAWPYQIYRRPGS